MAPNTNPTTETPADDVARDAVLFIFGSDLDTPPAFTGDWHKALKDTAARWSTEKPNPALAA